MTHRPKPPLRLVKVRLSGHPDDVQAVADQIARALSATEPSKHYPNRRGEGVRVYLEVSPE